MKTRVISLLLSWVFLSACGIAMAGIYMGTAANVPGAVEATRLPTPKAVVPYRQIAPAKIAANETVASSYSKAAPVRVGVDKNDAPSYRQTAPADVSVEEVAVVPYRVGVAQSTNCTPYSGKGPLPANPCGGVAPIASGPDSFTAHVKTGSLRDNVERIVSEAGWKDAVWKPKYDYNWRGEVTITATDVQGALSKLLEPYPLQAVFYQANHVVEIIPRRNT